MRKAFRSLLADIATFFPLTDSFPASFKLARFKRSKRTHITTVTRGMPVYLRNNWVDLEVFTATFRDKFHRSPFALPAAPTIVDLGSNIGLTLLDFKATFPDARIIGVEMDPANFACLEQNVQHLKGCDRINAAIWSEDGEIHYHDIDPQAHRVAQDQTSGTKKMRAMSMNTLLHHFSIERIDYLKMDIEGAEYDLFGSTDMAWLKKVSLLNIEFHPTPRFSYEEGFSFLKQVLEGAGFLVFKSTAHWASLFAIAPHLSVTG